MGCTDCIDALDNCYSYDSKSSLLFWISLTTWVYAAGSVLAYAIFYRNALFFCCLCRSTEPTDMEVTTAFGKWYTSMFWPRLADDPAPPEGLQAA
eukprot:TRINITY_DN11799_c0_g1_i1.p2 TRINITY_DN11799_c0_g1~~TRINITY_DN11799_c0_g1_i1.p2  ORF type:complete len:108 (+),score=8.21 TRINITY_DN11799_c0_g1_i1:41-325(+)